MKPTLRLSNTLIRFYTHNDVDSLIQYYLGSSTPVTPQMKEGRDFDDKNNTLIASSKVCIPEFNGFRLGENSTAQLKIEATIPKDLCDIRLVGVLDAYDETNEILYEFKTGLRSSAEYIRDHQIGIYALLLASIRKPIRCIRVARFNQYMNQTDWSERLFTPQILTDTIEMIDENYQGIFHILKEAGVFNDSTVWQ